MWGISRMWGFDFGGGCEFRGRDDGVELEARWAESSVDDGGGLGGYGAAEAGGAGGGWGADGDWDVDLPGEKDLAGGDDSAGGDCAGGSEGLGMRGFLN